MREVSLARVLRGTPAHGRIGLLSIWFHGHNNPRYAELLPRLERLDACLVRLSDRRIPRGLEYRIFRATRPLLYAGALRRAARGYRSLLTLDVEQIAAFHGALVADVDDPYYTERHARLLSRPNVRAWHQLKRPAIHPLYSRGRTKRW